MSYMQSQIPQTGSDTSSNDPLSINSRVFVGGLNTIQLQKNDVEQIFRRYGYISGISMHKGYAFVQFSSPMEARQAVQGEDQRTYASQTLGKSLSLRIYIFTYSIQKARYNQVKSYSQDKSL